MKKIIFLTSLIMMTGAASAKNIDINPYIGANISYSGVKFSSDGPYATGLKEFDDDFAEFSLNFGLKFDKYFGAEIFALGSSPSEVEYIYGSTKEEAEISYAGYGLNIMGYIPVDKQFDLIGMAGIGNYEIDLEYKETDIYGTNTYDLSEDDMGYTFGIGGAVNFNETFSLLAMYQYTIIDNEIIDNISKFTLGIRITF